jgi:hypothetical protein
MLQNYMIDLNDWKPQNLNQKKKQIQKRKAHIFCKVKLKKPSKK